LLVFSLSSHFAQDARSQEPKEWVTLFRRLLRIAKAAIKHRHVCCRSERSNSAPTGRILIKFDMYLFFEYWSI